MLHWQLVGEVGCGARACVLVTSALIRRKMLCACFADQGAGHRQLWDAGPGDRSGHRPTHRVGHRVGCQGTDHEGPGELFHQTDLAPLLPATPRLCVLARGTCTQGMHCTLQCRDAPLPAHPETEAACAAQVFLTSTHLAIVMELAHGGDLHAYMERHKPDCRLPEASARWIFQQLVTGMDYSHRRVGSPAACQA